MSATSVQCSSKRTGQGGSCVRWQVGLAQVIQQLQFDGVVAHLDETENA